MPHAHKKSMAFWTPRLLSTVILIPVVAYGVKADCIHDCRWRIGLTVLALLILDRLDSVFFDLQNTNIIMECSDSYQFADKILDQVQYAAALFLLWTYCGFWSPVIVIAYILRWIGVVLFAHEGSVGAKAKRWLALFPDLTKELLLLIAVLGTENASPLMITLTITAKIAFEVVRMLYAAKTCDDKLQKNTEIR